MNNYKRYIKIINIKLFKCKIDLKIGNPMCGLSKKSKILCKRKVNRYVCYVRKFVRYIRIERKVINMANHIKTVLTFRNLTKDDIDIILQLIATPVLHTSEGEIVEYGIDFNKIIPEPTTIEECPEDYRVKSAKEAHISEDETRPWFNWYDWHCTYWGTKWNAYDCYTLIGKSWIKFVFSTAWNVASPIIHRLDLLGYDMNIKFADEDLGSNCGEMTYSRRTGWITFCDKSRTFAKNLWEKY